MPGTARRRIAYLARRVRAIEFRRVWAIARAVGTVARRPAAVVFVDMLFCSVRYECAFQDYQDWDFALLSAAQRRTFMTHPKSDHIARRYNTGDDRHDLSDKSRFNTRFGDLIGREWLDLRTASAEQLASFAQRHPRAMAKVPDSLGGKGIGTVSTAELVTDTAARDALLAQRRFLLEELVVQHSSMARLNPSSVNTLRIVTFVTDGTVHVLARVLKIGAGGDVDNFSAGGMYTMLSPEGVALYAAFDAHDAIHAVHPITGTPIVGFAVPGFPEVIALAESAALRLVNVPYVGWDIAVTERGPVIIEANYNTGVFQAKPRASGEPQGLLPVYAAVAQF